MKYLVQKITQTRHSLQLHKTWLRTEGSGEKFNACRQVYRSKRRSAQEEKVAVMLSNVFFFKLTIDTGGNSEIVCPRKSQLDPLKPFGSI